MGPHIFFFFLSFVNTANKDEQQQPNGTKKLVWNVRPLLAALQQRRRYSWSRHFRRVGHENKTCVRILDRSKLQEGRKTGRNGPLACRMGQKSRQCYCISQDNRSDKYYFVFAAKTHSFLSLTIKYKRAHKGSCCESDQISCQF